MISNQSFLSFIIPFRNEENNLPKLVKSISIQEGWEFQQYIFVDDHSEDNGVEFLNNWRKKYPKVDISILTNQNNEGKKGAIRTGINSVKNHFIAFTDADCFLSSNWLKTSIDELPSSDLLIGRVWLKEGNSWFGQWQKMEFSSLQAVTLATTIKGVPFLCNAANLVVRKEVYLKFLNQRKDEAISSGDDIFLLEYCILNKKRINYNPLAFVETKTIENVKDFLNQRIRWFSKTSKYTSWQLNILNGLSGLWAMGNIILLGLFFLFDGSFYLMMILLKIYLDGQFLWNFYDKDKQQFSPIVYLSLIFIYPIYLLSILLLSIFYKPTWKGRKIT
jgi:cellulose synthase/poly-beta-1,6-N-acetylglucosamine synthase-like glycosyltransferase